MWCHHPATAHFGPQVEIPYLDFVLAECMRTHAYCFCTDLALGSQADSEGVKLEFANLLHQPHDLDSCSDDVGHQMQK